MAEDNVEIEFEELKSALQCPICLETFRPPVKILTCLHSFCADCLRDVLDSYSSGSSSSSSAAPAEDGSGELPRSLQLRCPVCRRTNFSFSRIEALEDNVFAHRQLDRLAELDQKLGSYGGFSYEDEDSGFSYEDEDGDGSSSGSSSSSSAAKPLSKSGSGLRRSLTSSCGGGPTEVVITEATKGKRKSFLTLVEKIHGREDQITRSLAVALDMEQKVAENVCNQLALVAEKFEQLEKALADKKYALTSELTRISTYKLEKLGQQRKQLERDLEGLRNTVAVSRALAGASDDVFLQLEQRYIEHLRRLEADPSFEAAPKERNSVNVTLPRSFDFLNVFGQITDRRIKVGTIGVAKDARVTLKNPLSITFSPAHELLIVANTDNNTIDMFDHKGAHVRTVSGAGGVSLTTPRAVYFDDQSQSIFVVDKASTVIRVFDIQGKFLRSINRERLMGTADTDVISSIAVYPGSGNIVLCDTTHHRIQIIDPTGRNLQFFGTKGADERCFDSPSAVALDPSSGNIFVCDSGNCRICLYDSDGNFKKAFGKKGTNPGEFEKPTGIAVDPITLSLAVSEPNRCRIQIFDKDCNYVYCFGAKGKADDYFAAPQGLAFDCRGTLLILDSTRIQLF